MILLWYGKFRPLCICGILSQVYDVCHVPGFGFWGVTKVVMGKGRMTIFGACE
ncbi:hypothetical protein SLEP1_g22209 [Rubroshorea leprosula]|uniref:Uncharacterized protein n=1 Tax=Rubroshorea leprosula TaxID=152421 RepID=A0AAV5JHQ9_9ROSI|nr:hypothetical protein SLEP1_g22209 [Rubroshorea leprosula]